MSWLSRLGGFTEQKKKAELQATEDNRFLMEIVTAMMMNNGGKLSADSTSLVKDGYGYNVSIYSIINYLITTAAAVPLVVEVRDGDGWERDNGDLQQLINQPTPITPYSLFIEETLGWKLIDGSAFVYAPRLENGVNKGQTLEMWTMPSAKMQIIGGGIRKPIEGYKYSEWRETIPVEDVMYLRYFNPVDAVTNPAGAWVGLSPLRAAVLTAKKANSAAVASVAAFENNGAMGVISAKGTQFDGLTKEQAEALEQTWKKRQGGANRYGKVAFTPGAVDYHALGRSPADLRLGESELQALRQLGAVYKLPTQLLNDYAGATFSNQEQAQKSVYTNTILPELKLLGQSLANWLGKSYYPKNEIRIVPDTSEIAVLQEDIGEKVAYLDKSWWLTPNERRAEMGKQPIEGDARMDEIHVPNTVTAASDLNVLGNLNADNINP